MDSNKNGLIINSSRGVLYASKENDFAAAARNVVLQMNQAIANTIAANII